VVKGESSGSYDFEVNCAAAVASGSHFFFVWG
jgi:hypothetical protein